MKISASIYSNNDRSLENLIKDLDNYNIDMFHVDFNDKKIDIKEVEDDIVEIRKISNKPIDLHIISDTPNQYSKFIIENKVEYVTYQLENIQEKLDFPISKKTKFGIAITSMTGINEFEKYKNDCDFILLMTTTPGESGGKFNNINFKKIREFKKSYPSKKIHIDGGVNDEIAFILRIHGVKSVVSGSYLVNGDIAKSLLELKSSVSSSQIKVSVFITVSSVDYHLVKDAPVPAQSAIQILDGGAKFVLQNGDALKVQSDTASSADVWFSRVDTISE